MAAKYPEKPIVGWSYGLNVSGITRKIEQDGNIMVFPGLESAARCLRKMLDYQDFRYRGVNTSTVFEIEVDYERANAVFNKAIKENRSYLFTDAFEILEAYGIDSPPWLVVNNRADVEDTDLALRFPLAVKLISQDVLHKSDAGGVLLGINNVDELLTGFDKIVAIAEQQQSRFEGVFLQEMIRGEQELIFGAKNDPVFGPGLIAGAGGIYTDLLDDFSFAIAPVDENTASDMIGKLRLAPTLNGARGSTPCDVGAMRNILLRLSRLICDFPEIRELDLNPVIARADGAIAVDARMLLNTGD